MAKILITVVLILASVLILELMLAVSIHIGIVVYDNSILGKTSFVVFDFRMNIIMRYNEGGAAYGIMELTSLF